MNRESLRGMTKYELSNLNKKLLDANISGTIITLGHYVIKVKFPHKLLGKQKKKTPRYVLNNIPFIHNSTLPMCYHIDEFYKKYKGVELLGIRLMEDGFKNKIMKIKRYVSPSTIKS